MLANEKVWGSAAVCMVLSAPVNADFYSDSHLTLGLRNFYVDRDFKQQNAPASRLGSWSQGFDLQFKSGFTEGPVQLGLDASSQFALRLDGGGGRGPDTVFPYSASNGEQPHDYGRAGVAAKLRFSKTEVRIGEHRPTFPVAYTDDSRQLMTSYEGATFESKEWANLTLNGGRFWQIATRQSSNRESIYLFGDSPKTNSDGLNFAGGRYDISPSLNVSYYYAQLEDIYQQHYVGVSKTIELAEGYSLKSDLRYYHQGEDGKRLSGEVDNRALGLMTALKAGASTYTIAYQRMYGEDGFPLLNGYVPAPYLVNWSILGFFRAQERSWQARYDYDFAGLGMPGLRATVRYLRGTDIKRGAGLEDNVESENNFFVSYVIQSGPLKSLGLEARNIKVKTRYGADFVENRLIATYTWKFW